METIRIIAEDTDPKNPFVARAEVLFGEGSVLEGMKLTGIVIGFVRGNLVVELPSPLGTQIDAAEESQMVPPFYSKSERVELAVHKRIIEAYEKTLEKP